MQGHYRNYVDGGHPHLSRIQPIDYTEGVYFHAILLLSLIFFSFLQPSDLFCVKCDRRPVLHSPPLMSVLKLKPQSCLVQFQPNLNPRGASTQRFGRNY